MANHLLRKHREVYSKFWDWSDNGLEWAILDGYQWTELGWFNYIQPLKAGKAGVGRSARSIRNFPMQANGAELLRLACIMASEDGVRICAPVHDAILIMTPETEIETELGRMQIHMRAASALILNGFELRSDSNIIVHPDRYMDERGTNFWNIVLSKLPKAQ
jgi:DNA polymerase I